MSAVPHPSHENQAPRKHAKSWGGRAKSQAAMVKSFFGFASGLAKKGIQTRPRLGLGDQGLPAVIVLFRKQEPGEVRHLLAFIGWKSFAQIGDFSGAHEMRLAHEVPRLKICIRPIHPISPHQKHIQKEPHDHHRADGDLDAHPRQRSHH